MARRYMNVAELEPGMLVHLVGWCRVMEVTVGEKKVALDYERPDHSRSIAQYDPADEVLVEVPEVPQ